MRKAGKGDKEIKRLGRSQEGWKKEEWKNLEKRTKGGEKEGKSINLNPWRRIAQGQK